MKSNLLVLLLTVLTFTSCTKNNDPKVDELILDFRARAELKAEKFEDALQSYLQLIEINPNRYGVHSNVGLLLNLLQKPEEALKSLKHALALAEKYQDKEAQFILNFNLGAYYGLLKDVPNALNYYQAALEIVPASIETKTNIELLIQQGQNGQGGSSSQQQQNQQQGEGDEQNNKDQNGDNKDQKQNEGDQPKDDQQRQSSPRYKPRPYQGEQLSEGDVKKILGELRNQEQKIRANFDKKEKGKARDNEKDW